MGKRTHATDGEGMQSTPTQLTEVCGDHVTLSDAWIASVEAKRMKLAGKGR